MNEQFDIEESEGGTLLREELLGDDILDGDVDGILTDDEEEDHEIIMDKFDDEDSF